MILTCPSCATSYLTPDEAIGPAGRTVRCKSCAHTWRAVAEEPLELTVSPPAVEREESLRDAPVDSLAETPAPELPKAYRAKVEQQRRLRRAAAHGAVWAGIASLFVGMIGAATLFRVELVELAPRTAAAYAMVGLKVNPTGLEFEAVSAKAAPNDPAKVLVSGALRNVREDERIAPPVRVALLDAQGAEIGHAVVRIDAAPVLPGGLQGFAAFIADPGGKGQGVAVDFVLNASPAADAGHEAEAEQAPQVRAHRPLPVADAAPEPGLRPALLPDDAPAPADMRPIDAVPLDSPPQETLPAVHG